MLLLHVPDDQCSVLEEPGRELRANTHWFASRRAGHAYLGYMQRQRDRMTGQLPEHPDYDRVNKFLADAYQAWWKRR